jgi:ribose 5-phosphate isomerase B
MNITPLAIASDHAGFELKTQLLAWLDERGMKAVDLGTHDTSSVDYPDYANALAQWMQGKPDARGILICGSGVGISIAANRHTHIRAALCTNGLTARLARQHNNANVLCLGARLIGTEVARDCVENFLASEFEGGRHEMRVKKLSL